MEEEKNVEQEGMSEDQGAHEGMDMNTEATPPAQTPQEQQPQGEQPHEEKSMGGAIGAIIIVAIIVIGGIYFASSKSDDSMMEATPSITDTAIEEVTEALQTQGTSDEIADIEADLDPSLLEDLDAGLADIEAELAL